MTERLNLPKLPLFVIATGFGLSSTFQAYWMRMLESGAPPPRSLVPLLGLNLVYWYVPALLAPSIMALALRYQLGRVPWSTQALVHVAGALVYSVAHTAVMLAAQALLFAASRPGSMAALWMHARLDYLRQLDWLLMTYLFLYTPLKRKTSLCVLAGAFPGAMPPLIGWASASGRLNIEAGILYAIVFLWQFPHFMAIAWMYREDYDRAGYLVLPKGNARIPFMTLETLLPLLALVAISIVQFPTRHAAIVCCAGALLSVGFLYFGLEFVLQRSRAAARRLLAASIVYLPLLFALSTIHCNRAGS